MEVFVSSRRRLAWPSGAQLKLLWPTLWELTWKAHIGGVVKTQVLHKASRCLCKTDALWGPKTTPLFSENKNVSDNNALHSLNVSALQNHTSLGFKIIFALFKGFSCII